MISQSRLLLRSLAKPQVSAAASSGLTYTRSGSAANSSAIYSGGAGHPFSNPGIRQVWPGSQDGPSQRHGWPGSSSPDEVDRKRAAPIQPMQAIAMAENADLRRQVERLSAQCSGLSAQLEELVRALRVQQDSAASAISPGNVILADNQSPQISSLQCSDVVLLAHQNVHEAQKEQLLREIMRTDGISREEALEAMHHMDTYSKHWNWLYSAPYYVGIGAALAAAVGSTVLVFHPTCVEAYASKVVGEDLPEGVENVSDMSLNQIGAWSWTWVEPMVGTASFVILCLQVARGQAGRMNFKCYRQFITGWRAHRTVQAFSQYNENVVGAWAKQLPPVKWSFVRNFR